MAETVLMPKLGLTMESGVIVSWLKKEGETVQKGEGLIEVESDKSTVAVDSQYSGTLLKIYHHAGEEVPCGKPIAVMGEPGDEVPEIAPASDGARGERHGVDGQAAQSEGSTAGVQRASQSGSSANAKRIIASPRARRYARQHGIDLSSVGEGGGAGGRIEERDLIRYQEYQKPVGGRISPLAKRVAELNEIDLAGVVGSGPGGKILRDDVERARLQTGENLPVGPRDSTPRSEIPVSRLRARIAERLSASVLTAPHYYLSLSIAVENLLAVRQDINSQGDESRISLTAMLIKIVGLLLKSHPLMNSWWAEDRIILHENADIAVAVSTDEGLLAPVVRSCQKKSMRQIDSELKELIAKTKRGQIQPHDYENPTFTISNLGMYNIESFTAIINPPASAILAVGKIIEKPVVVRGDVVVRPVMQTTVSCDHRVIDGAVSAAFLSDLKEVIENPLRTVLEPWY
jgi:pyruvate dehydrogenase E2 component (dihydrolipoamide acetyltransferase)